MSATLKVFRRMLVESAGINPLDFGSIVEEKLATACTGNPIQRREFNLSPGSSATLWDWAAEGSFTAMLIECDGFCWIAQKVDKPTASDGSNNAASGTDVNHAKDGLSCFAPLILQGMAVPVVPSATNYAASAFHATTEAGRRYAVYAKNPASATAAVKVTVLWVL